MAGRRVVCRTSVPPFPESAESTDNDRMFVTFRSKASKSFEASGSQESVKSPWDLMIVWLIRNLEWPRGGGASLVADMWSWPVVPA